MTVRAMSLDELQMALDWAADEGWNPGLEDAAAFHAADPAGFFLNEAGGKPVSAISVVNHDRILRFSGFIYVARSSGGKATEWISGERASFMQANAR